MYIKFFRNKSGGSKASVNYLLNDRVSDGTAKILKGNAEFTKAIIGEIKNKHKVSWGSINLSKGETLTQKEKETIMEDFEKTLCPGMSENQYNILWVEHTDKGRLELNFLIPKIELTTQKAFNPYFHKVDFSRIDMFEDIQNIKYNLESKKDPANQQTLQGEKKDINLTKDYKELDITLHQLVESGDIKNREQMIELLESSNIKVTRVNKDYISIKLPESKKAKKFKGSIYNEQFTSAKEFEAISERAEQRAREFKQRDTSRELEQTQQRLNKFNEQKAEQNRAKYQQRSEQTLRLENTRNSNSEQSNSRIINRGDISQEVYEDRNSFAKSRNPDREDNIQTIKGLRSSRVTNQRDRGTRIEEQISSTISQNHEEVGSSKELESRGKRGDISETERGTHIFRRGNELQVDIHKKGGLDDIRRRTLTRIRERARVQQLSHAEARQSRVELHQSITEQSKELRAELEQNSIELSKEYEPIVRTARATTEQSSNNIEAVESIERATSTRELINIGVQQFIDKVREFGTGLKQRFGQLVQESGDISRTAKENLDNKEQREQSYNTPSYGMRM